MKNVTIIGMGALGLLYGSIIKNSCIDIILQYLMDEKRAERLIDATFDINGTDMRFDIKTPENAEKADLLIVAVKTTALDSALDIMESVIDDNTVVISVLNGITSEEIIGSRFGFRHIIYSVAQGMDAMKFGNSLKYTQIGQLRIGITEKGSREDLSSITNFFDLTGIPYVVEDDIIFRLWGKFMLNVGINQTCMVYGQTYGQALSEGESNRTLIAAFREVIAVANAEGINLGERDINQYIEVLKTLSYDGLPSMAQDRINKKPSEVEAFAGTVISIAEKYNLYVPTNRFLYAKVREIEEGY